VDLQYEVNPNHNTYKSNGYNYSQPFPNIRFAYKLNESGWKGDPDGRIPLLKIKKAVIIQPAFFNEKVYREKGFKSAMEKTIDDWRPGID
jgi:hypothetical protein